MWTLFVQAVQNFKDMKNPLFFLTIMEINGIFSDYINYK